nr:ribosomal protein L29 [Cyanidioschyzonaceae sp. 2]
MENEQIAQLRKAIHRLIWRKSMKQMWKPHEYKKLRHKLAQLLYEQNQIVRNGGLLSHEKNDHRASEFSS